MRTLHLECSAGASGDMLAGALADLLPDPEGFIAEMNGIGLEGVSFSLGTAERGGIAGRRFIAEVDGREESAHGPDRAAGHGRTLSDVERLIDSLRIPDRVGEDAKAVYRIIAAAESRVHNRDIGEVHVHEVGMLDAVADIVAVCRLMEILGPETVTASPVRLGRGRVECAHGVLPVPAPATAEILKGVPVYAGDADGEFCTPTGAALLKHLADRFEPMPLMSFDRIGYGAGSRDPPVANILRAYTGESPRPLQDICEVACNLDDMCPEDIAAAAASLLDAGALDAYTAPIVMKKGRLGSLLACICRPEDADRFSRMMLEGTSTTGVRISAGRRHEMTPTVETIGTQYGEVRIKRSEGFGIVKEKPEFDDLMRIADEQGLPVKVVRDMLNR